MNFVDAASCQAYFGIMRNVCRLGHLASQLAWNDIVVEHRNFLTQYPNVLDTKPVFLFLSSCFPWFSHGFPMSLLGLDHPGISAVAEAYVQGLAENLAFFVSKCGWQVMAPAST